MAIDLTTVANVREFLKRHPPQSEDFKIFGSAVLAHLEAREIEFATFRTQTQKALRLIVEKLLPEEETSEGETTVGAASTETTDEPRRKQDPTPFPAGVASSGPPGGAPVAATAGTPNKTGPMDDNEVDENDITPNAGGGPAMNVSPIPSAPVAKAPMPTPKTPKNGKEAVS